MVLTSTGTTIEGYCVKEKKKVQFVPNPELKEIQTKRGMKYAKTGTCPDCGSKIFIFVKKE